MHEDAADTFVSPFGRLHTVQKGVEIRKARSLRDLLTKVADTSQMELNPEVFKSLRERLLHDAG